MFQKSSSPATRRNPFAFAGRLLSIIAIVGLAVAGTASAAAANSKYAGIVVDAKTGKVLYEDNADAPRYPASLTKMMTLYLTFEALKAGKITLETRIPVSAHAASEPPTKLGLRAGSTIRVEDVIDGLITLSANDAATAMGEYLGGSEANFALIMTNKAHALGMSRTTFRNANGLPDPRQVTTARDLSRLAIALREHFPSYYHFFSTQSFRYGNRLIRGHNHLLGHVEGVDGLKTGYTNASGYNLATSVRRNGRSIVGIVMGGRTWASRDAQMRELIAKYMPEASKSGDGDLIARTRMAPTLAAVDLPPHGPRPEFRKPSAARVALAYANDAQTADF
ncbi:MAG: D-alanyl-D-alanine carboxypeptidase family protein, partial [Pararhizobium sp.]